MKDGFYWATLTYPFGETEDKVIEHRKGEWYDPGWDAELRKTEFVLLSDRPLALPKTGWRHALWLGSIPFLISSGVVFWLQIGLALFTYLTWK